jgi:hypothetical protein
MDTPGTARGIVKPASPNLRNSANRSPISRGQRLRHHPTNPDRRRPYDARIGSAAFPNQPTGVPWTPHRRPPPRTFEVFNRPHVPWSM